LAGRRSHARRGWGGQPSAVRFELPHTGFVPIAACHWQSIANVLAAHGFAEPLRRLGLSWGIRWEWDGILFGGGRWRSLLAQLFGVTVRHLAPAEPADARSLELACLARGRPFVAEIDAYYVPSPYQGREHVVHTVIVAGQDDEEAAIIDAMNNPLLETVPLDVYRTMRTHACAGRTEPNLLYVPSVGPYAEPSPEEVAGAVRADVARHADGDLAQLRAFVEHAAGSPTPVSVSRVAAERHQAAMLFELLGESGIAGAVELAGELRTLSDEWYMVHMLTSHDRAQEPRHRRRILRLLDRLIEAETRVVAVARGG